MKKNRLKELLPFVLKWMLWNALYILPALYAIIWIIVKVKILG
jgi:hypothetical protein